MGFKIFEVKDKKIIDEFVPHNSMDGGILQSWEWGEFKESQGSKIYRLGVVDDQSNLKLLATIHKQVFGKMFNIFYIPRGPLFDTGDINNLELQKQVLDFFLKEMSDRALKEKSLMIRMDPAWTTNYFKREYLADFGFVKGKRSIQPEHTLIIDLRLDHELLLGSMKQKTRYNINLAEKKGVIVRSSQDLKDVDVFVNLLKKTSSRQKLRSYSGDYFKNLFEIFSKNGNAYIFIAKHQGIDIAANFILVYGDTAYYLYGASDYTYRNVMAPYIVHWETMKTVKEKGIDLYDLWGVSGQTISDSREKNWEGFSKFKMGFAPTRGITEYVGTWEFPYKQKTYKLLNFIR